MVLSLQIPSGRSIVWSYSEEQLLSLGPSSSAVAISSYAGFAGLYNNPPPASGASFQGHKQHNWPLQWDTCGK